MTYIYTPTKPRKQPLKAALNKDRLYQSADGKWHTDGFVMVKAPLPDIWRVDNLGNRDGLVEKLIRNNTKKAKAWQAARVLAEFDDPHIRQKIQGGLLVIEEHYHTGPILVARARFDYIMALWPTAEILTERRSTFVAFRQDKSMVGFLAEVQYADPSEISAAMNQAIKEQA